MYKSYYLLVLGRYLHQWFLVLCVWLLFSFILDNPLMCWGRSFWRQLPWIFIWCWHDAVEETFDCFWVCYFFPHLSWVVDYVTINCDPALFRFLFLGLKVAPETCICYLLAFWNFVCCDKVNCFCAFVPLWRPLIRWKIYWQLIFAMFLWFVHFKQDDSIPSLFLLLGQWFHPWTLKRWIHWPLYL